MNTVKVEKIPISKCENCGSFRVMMTDDGPECSDCDFDNQEENVNLSEEVEYLIYQFGKEKE